MAKPKKMAKVPKGSQPGKPLDETALSQITSKFEQNLKGSEHKRKNPPTNDSTKQNRKRQRKSGNGPPKSENGSRKSSGKNEIDSLLEEIRALGGDENDLELVQDIDSSDEDLIKDDQKPVDKTLKDELAAFSRTLGFEGHQPSEASEDEQDGGSIDHGEQEDDDGASDPDHQSAKDDDEDDDDTGPRKVENLTFEPRADWHATKLPKLPGPSTDQVGQYTGAIESFKRHAKALLDEDAARYRTSIFASSSHKFLSTIMSSGTLTDKVSALTLAVQESPVHNIKAFDALMTLSSKKSRAQAIGAIGALVDLLGPGAVLPSGRRLRTFSTQPGLIGTLQQTATKSWKPGQPLPGKLTGMHLIYWAYEDWLKETYFKILQLLESWSSDEIEYSRSRALDFVYGLLREKPEQEANLLRLLVNKLGDRDRKIASRASYLLLQLQTSHPGMKPIIIRTVEQQILLHPSQDHRSKYYAINTLNQTILSAKEPSIAESLMRVYFDLFVTLLKAGSLGISFQTDGDKSEGAEKKKSRPGKPSGSSKSPKPSEQDVDAADKLVSAILTGVNRAAPFVGANDAVMENHMDTLFKIAHSANFNTGIQALLLIQHLSTARSLGTERFYRTLYESLLDPRLVTSSKQALYLNLLLRALKNDVDVRRVKAFAKRMLQVSHLHQPPFICGLLYVISHLRETFPDLATLIEEPEESIFDDEAAHQMPAYDGRKRDPEYSNAQRSCLWEVLPIQAHYHPSVSVFAWALMDKEQTLQKPDLDSHSLIRFLDKFVYKNPKTTDSTRGVSIMQPLKATKDLGDIWLGSRGAGSAPTSVNSSTFWNKKSEDVAAEDIFFHKYFQHAAKEPKKSSNAALGDDNESEEEGEIWKALVASRPDVDGDADYEGFDDLDENEMASDEDESPPASLEGDSDDESIGGVDIEGDSEEGEELGEDDASDNGGSEGEAELVAAEDDSDDNEVDSKEEEKKKRKARRKQIKDLPMFASVDDYEQLLAQEEDGIF